MRKMRILAVMAVTMMLFGGCGTTANNLGGATDGYNDAVYGNYYQNGYGNSENGGPAYWDGYGVNDGRTMGSTDRTSYGMRKDVRDVGDRVERAAEDLMGNTNDAGENTGTNAMLD